LKDSAKILIVDDDSLVLRTLKLTFQSDYQVSLAASGKEALDTLNSMSDIEAIVLDIKMAPMDGIETDKKINN
jgi:CheY-like chemotaxis protein